MQEKCANCDVPLQEFEDSYVCQLCGLVSLSPRVQTQHDSYRDHGELWVDPTETKQQNVVRKALTKLFAEIRLPELASKHEWVEDRVWKIAQQQLELQKATGNKKNNVDREIIGTLFLNSVPHEEDKKALRERMRVAGLAATPTSTKKRKSLDLLLEAEASSSCPTDQACSTTTMFKPDFLCTLTLMAEKLEKDNVTMTKKECARLSLVAEEQLEQVKALARMRAAPVAVAVALKYGKPLSGLSPSKGMFNSEELRSLFAAMSVTKSSVQKAYSKLT